MPNNKAPSHKKRNTPARKPVVLANNADPRPVKPRKRRVRKPTGKSVSHGHVHAICAVTNPFCPAAKGSKWPDGCAGSTLTEQFRGSYTMSSSADGNGIICFAPGAPFGYLPSISSTTTTATTNSAWSSYKSGSMLSTYGFDFRIVSFGVIARCVASATQASGLITFGTSRPLILSTAYTLGTQLYSNVTVKAIQPGLELSWISHNIGSDAHAFLPLTTNLSNPPADWTALTVELTGVTASIPVVNFEWFMNVEFNPTPTSAIVSLAKPNPPKIPAAEVATSKVHASLGSFIEGGIKQVEDAVFNHASEALAAVIDDPLTSLAALFGAF